MCKSCSGDSSVVLDHSAARTYMDKISKHLAKLICSPPFPHKFNVGGHRGEPLRMDKISKHQEQHDVNFQCAFNIDLAGAGCEACKMLFQSVWILCPSTVWKYCGLAVHGGNGAVKICGFCFFVVVASGFGGNGDEPKLILWSDVSWYRQRTVSRTSGYGQSPFVAIWRVTETRTRRVSTTVPSHHHTYASIDVCVFCSCSHSIPWRRLPRKRVELVELVRTCCRTCSKNV